MSIKDKPTTGIQVAVTILEKWGATVEQGTAILRVSPETYAQAKQQKPEWQVTLDEDQLARISYVLNIHAALRVLFDNPDNLYGFMAMPNYNEGFDGRSALEVIACGDIGTLRETWLRVNMERPAIMKAELTCKLGYWPAIISQYAEAYRSAVKAEATDSQGPTRDDLAAGQCIPSCWAAHPPPR
ncbi:hypothetical protein [Billgrantia diversa]|uniref:hypothetical protein n=1 Tax=Halomonas sp. MCCC 1A13316 TaxID=2733487 RepID=UPI001E317473|nr:hypothetical protein [Halomonas sp. MCCC 1A13316]